MKTATFLPLLVLIVLAGCSGPQSDVNQGSQVDGTPDTTAVDPGSLEGLDEELSTVDTLEGDLSLEDGFDEDFLSNLDW